MASKALRFAKENLRDGVKDDNAHWHDTPYFSEDATACDNFEADYGLPEGIDVNIPPELAFPPIHNYTECHPERGGRRGDRRVEGPFVSRQRLGGTDIGRAIPPFGDRVPLIPEIPPPYVRDYTAEAETAMFEATPEDMELNEILNSRATRPLTAAPMSISATPIARSSASSSAPTTPATPPKPSSRTSSAPPNNCSRSRPPRKPPPSKKLPKKKPRSKHSPNWSKSKSHR